MENDDARHELYPALPPRHSGLLDVGDGHTIYFEECGNPDGIPVVIIHGGPGAGCNPQMRRYHDPRNYRIILFDQRGCGRSRPHASLSANTTWHLVADMERLRVYLGIDRWQLFGGSWGSTLALAYAQSHPHRVISMILRGIFLVRASELRWFYEDGCNVLFPDAYARFVEPIPQEERHNLIAAYYRRLTHPSEAVRLQAAKTWSGWEGATLSLLPDQRRQRVFDMDAYMLAFARIECHYFAHGGFMEADGQLLRDAHLLQGIPATLVNGRYDVITPVKNAWELAQVWPDARLQIIPDAGHAMSEPGIVKALLNATRKHQQLSLTTSRC